jgi:hypothetical protein
LEPLSDGDDVRQFARNQRSINAAAQNGAAMSGNGVNRRIAGQHFGDLVTAYADQSGRRIASR